MNLKTISELQGKTEILLNRLMDAKESALSSKNNRSSIESAVLVRYAIIEVSSHIPKIQGVDKNMLLDELKSILFQLDGIEDSDRKEITRKREIVMSRQIIMAVYYSAINQVTLKQAGDLYGKDHATVLHACKTINNLRETDKSFNEYYSRIWEWGKRQDPNFKLVPKGI